jgi:Tfp pilus assembly protein PilF
VPLKRRHNLLAVCVSVVLILAVPRIGAGPAPASAASRTLDGGQIKGDSDPLVTFNHAVALQQQGQLEAAVVAWRNFLIQQPRNLAGLSNLAVVLARLGRFEEAIDEYERALKIEPKNATVRLNLAIARYKAAQFREAAKELARVRVIQPGNLQATLLEADCHLRMGDAQAVIALLEPIEAKRLSDEKGLNDAKGSNEAARSNDENGLAIAYMLGMAYLRAGKPDLGQVRIDRILRNGESAEAHVLMGLALREAHDLAGAVQSFGKAVALNPNLPDVHAMYGLALIASGNRDKAREEFEAELKANPHDYTANVNLGVIAKEDQRFDEAAAFLDRALKVRPADPAARYQVATLKMAANDIDTARATLEALVAEHPNWLEPHVSLATVYYRLKRKADGDREREIVDRLTKEAQARQPGAQTPPTPPTPATPPSSDRRP